MATSAHACCHTHGWEGCAGIQIEGAVCFLCRKSVAAKPANVSYALQLVHGIQLELDYRAALEVVAHLLSHCWASPPSPGHTRQPDAMCTR